MSDAPHNRSREVSEEELLRAIAPCGLVCHTCTASSEGVIRALSGELTALLEGFDRFADRFSGYEPRLKGYPEFKQVLELLAEASCEGCRTGSCPYPNCPVAPCVRERECRFCYECGDFPCAKLESDEHMGPGWIRRNRRMREIGVAAYFAEVRDVSHYAK